MKTNSAVDEWLDHLHTDLQPIPRALIAVGYSINDPFNRLCYVAAQKKAHIRIRNGGEAQNPAVVELVAAKRNHALEAHARMKKSKA